MQQVNTQAIHRLWLRWIDEKVYTVQCTPYVIHAVNHAHKKLEIRDQQIVLCRAWPFTCVVSRSCSCITVKLRHGPMDTYFPLIMNLIINFSDVMNHIDGCDVMH